VHLLTKYNKRKDGHICFLLINFLLKIQHLRKVLLNENNMAKRFVMTIYFTITIIIIIIIIVTYDTLHLVRPDCQDRG
jgi:hypothetical protein